MYTTSRQPEWRLLGYILFGWSLMYSHGFTVRQRIVQFDTRRSSDRRPHSRRKAVDLSEIPNLVTAGLHHLPTVPHGPEEATTSLSSILSTLYSATAEGVLQPAHGHSQPLFGPPDPYLSAGKSIAPPAKALLDMGVEKANVISGGDLTLPSDVKAAIAKGWTVLDGSHMKPEDVLPGFAKTGGILPQHNPRIVPDSPETFAAQVEWSARFLNVVDKLPYMALAYGLVDFFLLKPNLDLYKEDVEEEPSAIFMETASATAFRMGVFAVIAVVTLGMFGG